MKKDSFHISKDIVDALVENILQKTPIRFHDSSSETPTINPTDSQSLSNPSSRESMFRKWIITRKTLGRQEVEGIRTEIISELQESIEKLFQNELSVFKTKIWRISL